MNTSELIRYMKTMQNSFNWIMIEYCEQLRHGKCDPSPKSQTEFISVLCNEIFRDFSGTINLIKLRIRQSQKSLNPQDANKIPQQIAKAEEELGQKQKQYEGNEQVSRLASLNKIGLSSDSPTQQESTNNTDDNQSVFSNGNQPTTYGSSSSSSSSYRDDFGIIKSFSNNPFRGSKDFPSNMPEFIMPSSSNPQRRPGRPPLTTTASKNQKSHEWIYRQFKKYYDPEKRNKHQVTVEIANFTKWSTSTILNIVKRQEQIEKEEQMNSSMDSDSDGYDHHTHYRHRDRHYDRHNYQQKESHHFSNKHHQYNQQLSSNNINNKRHSDEMYQSSETKGSPKKSFKFDDEDEEEFEASREKFPQKMVKREFSQADSEVQSEEENQQE